MLMTIMLDEAQLLAALPPGSTITTTENLFTDDVEVNIIAPTPAGWVHNRQRFERYMSEHIFDAVRMMVDAMRGQIDVLSADAKRAAEALGALANLPAPLRRRSSTDGGLNPDAPVIDEEDAIRLLEETAEKYGRNHVDFTHMFMGRGGCIVGRLMCDLLGVDHWQPTELFSMAHPGRPPVEGGIQFTDGAEHVLAVAMHWNDRGLTWGEIAARAKGGHQVQFEDPWEAKTQP